ncbi:MAG: hypothetical protein NT005_04205, partial [Spirochaetes bacterium]|nr:hypothetical protein [Spirochaetota bacterium]
GLGGREAEAGHSGLTAFCYHGAPATVAFALTVPLMSKSSPLARMTAANRAEYTNLERGGFVLYSSRTDEAPRP